MANHKSAEKRYRQSLKKRARNRSVKGAIRTTVKESTALKSSGKVAEAKTTARTAESMLASAVKKGILHKKAARRQISRLAKRVAK